MAVVVTAVGPLDVVGRRKGWWPWEVERGKYEFKFGDGIKVDVDCTERRDCGEMGGVTGDRRMLSGMASEVPVTVEACVLGGLGVAGGVGGLYIAGAMVFI